RPLLNAHFVPLTVGQTSYNYLKRFTAAIHVLKSLFLYSPRQHNIFRCHAKYPRQSSLFFSPPH
ncbi:TPA: hypothetical protein ACJZPP_002150, partial [Streptococcus pneumoniae]